MPFSDRVTSAWRWLGLEGVLLLAAFLCDLAVVLPASVDSLGPRGRDLLLLPGMVALGACALWARTRPAVAVFAGAATLFASTFLIRATDAAAYTTLLSHVSLSETVAGLELVFFCVRWVRWAESIVGTGTLVLATLLATAYRNGSDSRGLSETMLLGMVLLVAVVLAGLHFRRGQAPRKESAVRDLVREQWPLIGALSLPVFLELYQLLDSNIRALPALTCSLAAAATAVYATRRPLRAGLLLAGIISATSAALWIAPRQYLLGFGALPFTEIVAGIIVVVLLVRSVEPKRAWGAIALMSAAVAFTTLTTVVSGRGRAHMSDLRDLVIAAVLVLGIAVAAGLYFRARDSERRKVVEAAVADAQNSERMALARELHDLVAHHVTGIIVQAQAAKVIADQNPKVALEVIERIEAAGTEAMTAMRRLVGSMRAGGEAVTDQATMDLDADLRRLVESGHHGVPAEADVRVPADLPQEVARSALRLVQESLTNIGKHAAGATRACVLAEVRDGELHIRVADDGRQVVARPAGGSGGYGLVGMRERVELLHGRLAAGPAPDGGWVVEAWLPVEEQD
ncbi:sensor histidine kinase [Amycolatopsis methanolica]|uniref:histidine kinase n=1 Tax=Amycolatopsis methanolica 239 TaxID=1068978 RepID=A0A076N2M1_AMYME|nr:histidine kinase [Amycolatopsis methanolica]AIJ27078.1 Signal transduction histidine kinase [Amycolatopsis methanolica 239]